MSDQGKSSASTNALLALVLGIFSFLGGSILTAIPAWILGKSVLDSSVDVTDNERNHAKIGMILGQVAVALSVLGLIVGLVFMSSIMSMFRDLEEQSFGPEAKPGITIESDKELSEGARDPRGTAQQGLTASWREVVADERKTAAS